jgi:2,3-bisphosphoglycerate-dependent phosphoglycerate mutase
MSNGKRVIIATHGNRLRVLLKYSDNLSNEETARLNIPTSLSVVYELEDDLRPIRSYYLAN